MYIADADNNRIRKVTVSTSTPSFTPTSAPSSPTVTPTYYPTFSPSVDVITTFAGTGAASYSGGNGAATSATIYYPFGVALDSSGRPRHSISLALF